MLINEIRNFSKDVPEKKIILDQLGPDDAARLVLQIAAYSTLDRFENTKKLARYADIETNEMDSFIGEVIDDLNRLTTSKNLESALKSAKEGKI